MQKEHFLLPQQQALEITAGYGKARKGSMGARKRKGRLGALKGGSEFPSHSSFAFVGYVKAWEERMGARKRKGSVGARKGGSEFPSKLPFALVSSEGPEYDANAPVCISWVQEDGVSKLTIASFMFDKELPVPASITLELIKSNPVEATWKAAHFYYDCWARGLRELRNRSLEAKREASRLLEARKKLKARRSLTAKQNIINSEIKEMELENLRKLRAATYLQEHELPPCEPRTEFCQGLAGEMHSQCRGDKTVGPYCAKCAPTVAAFEKQDIYICQEIRTKEMQRDRERVRKAVEEPMFRTFLAALVERTSGLAVPTGRVGRPFLQELGSELGGSEMLFPKNLCSKQARLADLHLWFELLRQAVGRLKSVYSQDELDKALNRACDKYAKR